MSGENGYTNVSARIASTVEIFVNGVSEGFLDSTTVNGTTVGSVTLDTTASTMRTCTFECIDPYGILTPSDSGGGLLTPDGVEVKITVGFMVNDQYVGFPQGVFTVTECDSTTGTGLNDDPGGILTVSGEDRSGRIGRNPFSDLFTIPAGSTVTQAITAVLAKSAPWCTDYSIEASYMTLAAQTLTAGTSPWSAIQQFATAVGMVAYFDAHGKLIVRTAPTTTSSPVELAIIDGPQQIATDVTHSTTAVPGYNGVIVTSSTPNSNPVTGVAWDMDPTSPTYALGPYGYVPAPPVTVSTVSTVSQANAVAAVLLPQVLGLTRQVTIDMIPAPFLDAYDLVFVTNAATNVNGTYILKGSQIYLDYSDVENITVLPVGTRISALVDLKSIPSVAEFAPTTPLASGGGQYTYYKYGPYTYGYSSSSGSTSFASRLARYGPTALFRFGRGEREFRRLIFDGAGRWVPSLGSSGGSDAADSVDAIVREL